MSRVVLVLPTQTYRAPDFVEAARRVGAEVVVASEEPQALAGEMGHRAIEIDLCDPHGSADRIVSWDERAPLDAVLAVDDQGVEIAALAAHKLGLDHNPPEAVRATRDKGLLRERLTAAGRLQPPFRYAGPADDAGALAAEIGFPVVVKATGLAASRGVIRADTEDDTIEAVARVRTIVEDDEAPVIVERFVEGDEVAVEGLLREGSLEVLAVFDKPDPLVGPYFEETIYVTPSRLPEDVQAAIGAETARTCEALGLRTGPVHAELRVVGDGVVLLEVAARAIGGLCARVLTFGLGMSLEEVLLRHALGRPLGRVVREREAAGVMMVPIPKRGILSAVEGREEALAVPDVVGLEITATLGREIVPLPEGDRYLGFLFAKSDRPELVETALREAHARLRIVVT